MIKIRNLNHLVLFVSNVAVSEQFYCQLLGFKLREKMGDAAVFLYAGGSSNHHDLGLIYAGPDARPLADGPRIGLYHAAWEVASFPDLQEAKIQLQAAGVLLGESDHGNSLSLYARDPDHNEFEVFWMVPPADWPKRAFGVHPLNWEEVQATYGQK